MLSSGDWIGMLMIEAGYDRAKMRQELSLSGSGFQHLLSKVRAGRAEQLIDIFRAAGVKLHPSYEKRFLQSCAMGSVQKYHDHLKRLFYSTLSLGGCLRVLQPLYGGTRQDLYKKLNVGEASWKRWMRDASIPESDQRIRRIINIFSLSKTCAERLLLVYHFKNFQEYLKLESGWKERLTAGESIGDTLSDIIASSRAQRKHWFCKYKNSESHKWVYGLAFGRFKWWHYGDGTLSDAEQRFLVENLPIQDELRSVFTQKLDQKQMLRLAHQRAGSLLSR